MTKFSRYLRTTAFKLSLVYLLVFGAFTTAIIVYVSFNATRLFSERLWEDTEREIDRLVRLYELEGIRWLAHFIESRARDPGANLYLLTDFVGRPIAGNIAEIPRGISDENRSKRRPLPYIRHGDYEEYRLKAPFENLDNIQSDETDSVASAYGSPHTALMDRRHLQGGFQLIVGRDIGEQNKLHELLSSSLRAVFFTILALGVFTWFFVARLVMRRIDQIAHTSVQIMAGDLSGRLPITGNGDEFDRLGESLNAMLERIESLLYGLKDVSDNIAHDLKTPLTRLKNEIEGTLRKGTSETDYRTALENALSESDSLIRTFDALLMISRLESGSLRQVEETVDLSQIVDDIAELYEPMAEEEKITIRVKASACVEILASKDLIAQAVINLIENAIKYAPVDNGRVCTITLSVGTTNDNKALVQVADNGAGIPQHARENVIQRFTRLEKNRLIPGSGLGLALVSAVAQVYAGQLKLKDNAPGLLCELSFPLKPVPPKIAAAAGQPV